MEEVSETRVVSSVILFCFEHSVCVRVCFLSLKGVQPVEILQAFIPVANRHQSPIFPLIVKAVFQTKRIHLI